MDINKLRQTFNLIEYISKPMDKNEMLLLYRVNNVIPERTELYLDFIRDLYNTVTTTYLGDDVMTLGDVKKHFKWCWNKVNTNFKREHIYFRENPEIFIYFMTLFMESFYEEDKTDTNIYKLMEFWENAFNYEKVKTLSEMEVFLDIYKLFDEVIYV